LNRDELIRRLSATFLEELADNVRVFNQELLLLESEPASERRQEAIHALFRVAHSLKGAARAVDAHGIESVAHRLEDLLAKIRDGRRRLAPDLFAVLFASADGFVAAGRRFAEDPAADSGLSEVTRQLEIALSAADDAPLIVEASPVPPVIAAAVPAPTPIVQVAAVADAAAGVGRSSSVTTAVGDSGSLRIGRARIDGLLRQGSELRVTRRRFEARRDELAVIQETLARFHAEWRAGGRALRRFSNRNARAEAAGEAPAPLLPKRLTRLLERAEDELSRLTRDVERLSLGLRQDAKLLDRVAEPLEGAIHRLRMQPFLQACEGLSRVVRDLSTEQQKQVDLKIEGGETELDRAIVERLREPLLHLVRNAIDHGLEASAERVRQQKPERSTLRISALANGDTVEIRVADDGRGLDFTAIAARLAERGTIVSDRAELERAIFSPGFSTAKVVSGVSGRGVGLDVVRSVVERMNGSISVDATERGTSFCLILPLTLSTMRVLFVRVADQVLAIPSLGIEALLRVDPSALKSVGDKTLIERRGVPVPLSALGKLLGLTASVEPTARLQAVVLRSGERRVAVVVDELLSEQEVVLKPLGPRMQGLPHVSSATFLPSGEVALVLKASSLVTSSIELPAFELADGPGATRTDARKRLLLADDSITTRALERSILEAAGYEVIIANDGLSAWKLLQEQGADLLLSDVEMPQMDGLSLTETIRASTRFRDLPVILLTSRDAEEDRARGLRAGADAYLVKSAFDQTGLLQAIEQLL